MLLQLPVLPNHAPQALQGELANLRAKSAASQQKVEEARASQAQNRSANAVLDSLTKLSQTGRVQGFHVGVNIDDLLYLPHDYHRVDLAV